MRTIDVGGNQGRGNPPAKTGWPAPELAQDDHRPLFLWFASKPDARLRVREAAARIQDVEGTLDEPIRRWNVLAVLFALLCFALMGAAAVWLT